VQEPRTQPPLQAFELAADHGSRQFQRLGGARQAALIGDLDEGSDGAQVIHD